MMKVKEIQYYNTMWQTSLGKAKEENEINVLLKENPLGENSR